MSRRRGPRGRALFVAGTILAIGAAVAWAARYLDFGSGSLHAAARPLTVAAIAAWVFWVGFAVLATVMIRAGRNRGAQSLVHLQSMAAVLVFLMAFGTMLGGLQATLVSLGLLGFGLTLALQRPILAVAGWATLVFGGSVREGDRIQIGQVSGDVLDIRLFTTRIWEIGAPDGGTPGRPTGRVRTLSNAAFVEQAVANSTNDTATVFDEFVVNVAFESNQELAQQLLLESGTHVVDAKAHQRMAGDYRRLTQGLSIEAEFPDKPFILAESKASWMEYRLRYLVDARRASRVQSSLSLKWSELTAAHPDKILAIYPRTQPMAIKGDGTPLN